MTVSVLLMITELVLTGVAGFQVYLFKQISAARREHLEFRIEVAERYVRAEHIDKAMEKLEDRLEQRLQHLFNQPPQRKRS
ncbi:uncharacterized protein HemY [Pseudomonas migulae]|uniref:Uncharacterized protein n=1 Tax=Pseudomonas fluorescens TaxID=294 RepID=A0A5E7JXB9_PSEFL|nr:MULTISPECIES: hypothetical protein [Pseudomonas fluorescens group]MCP1500646.1 uncharacterized protein HemY [Pseudomonas migulae]VVO92532.1 hypothetical protein PS870_02394 [Pseudomonas fluorescens]